MKIVTLYNHKGGVSKTTSTFNLAHLLRLKGKKVLIIDADPQCNLTELSLAKLIAELDEKSQKKGEVVELPGTSILDILNQRISGDVPFIDIDKIEPIELKDHLYLIKGSVDLNSIEDDLAEAHIQRFARRLNLMRTYVCIGDFLCRIAERYNFDYIFLDVGPSSGALTRACFLACDCFFIPVSPDRFNVQAIKTLSKIIDRWLTEHHQIYSDYKKLGLPIRHGKPSFLGVIVQFFKLYKGKPKAGYDFWMSKIPGEVTNYLFPVLEKYSSEEHNLNPYGNDIIATKVPDFGQLAPIMQEVGKPVFEIGQKDTALITSSGKPWGGATWQDAEKRMTDYKKSFEDLYRRLQGI